jgi:hypothetical protein
MTGSAKKATVKGLNEFPRDHMRVGLVRWLVGITLAIGYFVFLYRFFRGKVSLEDTEGY